MPLALCTRLFVRALIWSLKSVHRLLRGNGVERLRARAQGRLISLRLPAALLATLRAEATKAKMPTQRLIRMLIEAQLADEVDRLEQVRGQPSRNFSPLQRRLKMRFVLSAIWIAFFALLGQARAESVGFRTLRCD